MKESDFCKAMLVRRDKGKTSRYECVLQGAHAEHQSASGMKWAADPGLHPVSRADFDRLERKVDECLRRLDERDARDAAIRGALSSFDASIAASTATIGAPGKVVVTGHS